MHENAYTRSKATPNMSTKSTESTGQSTIISALPDTVNVPFNAPSIPSSVDIRPNAQIQQRVEELQQLSNPGIGTKIKSLRGGTVGIFVRHHVKWPHGHVLVGSTKEQEGGSVV